jgi:hypothetical protein
MATEAQVIANRHNAEKSSGPRTPEGKATVSQNAVKHGLSGRRDVIKGEDQAEFDRHREALLKELAPVGAVETMLAERVVSLSWRLQRVGRMQNEVFDALLANEATPLARLARSLIPGKAAEDDGLDLGRAAIKDFANSRVLDRLLMYERRMENSLLKTLNDLHLRRLRVREYISRQMDELDNSGPADAWQAGAADLGRGPDARDSRARCPRHDADRMSATRMGQHSTIPSFQDFADGADEPFAPEPSCKTKPICGLGSRPGNTLDGWHRQTCLTVRSGLAQFLRGRTGKRVCPCHPRCAPGVLPEDRRY